MYLFNALRGLDHFDFRNIVGPRGIAEQFSDLAAELKHLVQDRLIHSQTALETSVRNAARLWVLCALKLIID